MLKLDVIKEIVLFIYIFYENSMIHFMQMVSEKTK